LSNFKFLHVADIHLDSPLLGLARYEGVPVDEVRLATRTALTSLVELAIVEGVAFVVIAGDIYDGDWPHFGTGLFFCAAMGRLDKAGIEVYLLYGNHDAQSVLTKKLPLPPNVHVFPTNKSKTFVHAGTGAVLHGRSYKDRDTRENLATQYPTAVEGTFNIGVLHTALSGRPPHASYAPCSVSELCAKGYQYWALGHVHDFEVVSKSPYIVFPGNLQGRSIRECGPKGAVVVAVQDLDVRPDPQQIPLDSVRWMRVDIDVTDIGSETDLHARIRTRLDEAFGTQSDGHALLIRVALLGNTSLHGWLIGAKDQLDNDIRGIAISVSERLWVEKILLRTGPLVQVSAGGSSIVDELGSLLAEGAKDPDLNQKLLADLSEFLGRIPSDLAMEDDLLFAVRQGQTEDLLGMATAALTARLEGEAK
jgi:DNA repair exonuclease SbcCD nuclease subunit